MPKPETPTTKRGQRTRESLVTAARRVFERDGYADSRLVDITAEARCSIGTFYTYFESKEEILAEVLSAAGEDMLHPGTERLAPVDDPVAVIRESNRAYLQAYGRNAALMALLHQVTTLDPRFGAVRQERNDAFLERNARAIRDLQERGLADRGVDAELAAAALSGMVSRLAQSHFSAEPGMTRGRDLDDIADTATRLWTNALGLTSPELEAAELDTQDHEGGAA